MFGMEEREREKERFSDPVTARYRYIEWFGCRFSPAGAEIFAMTRL